MKTMIQIEDRDLLLKEELNTADQQVPLVDGGPARGVAGHSSGGMVIGEADWHER